jgi:diguanylate cyclase (GGDEF)-like protein/PAS domain S-box-containing protein
MFDFVPLHCLDQVREQMRRTLASKLTLRDENEVMLHDGTFRWISWSNRAFRAKDGQPVGVHSVGRDIDDRKRAELQLMQSEARYRMLADHSTDLIFQYDRNMVRRYVSPACREIFGIEPEEMVNRPSFLETHDDELDDIKQAYKDVGSGKLERTSVVYRVKHKAGHWVWVEAAIRGTRDPVTNEPSGLIGAIRDITAKKEIEEKLAEANRRLEILAAQDGLTEIYNRRAFDEMLAREIKIARRESTSLSLLMIDVDVFKAYNDRYGHLAGDAVLRKVSAAIKTAIRRPGDLAARYGGEEFVVLLPNTDPQGARQVSEAIRGNVEILALAHAASPWSTVTVSIGIASAHNADPDSLNHDMLLMRADNALYLAKNAGRNTVALWCPASVDDSQARAG